MSLALAGQPAEGVRILREVAGLPGASPRVRQNLALAYGLLGRDDDARAILQIDLPPNEVDDNLRYYRTLRQRLAGGRQP